MKNREGKLLWRCWRCGHIQTEPTSYVIPKVLRTDANILYLDIEVSKSLIYNYGLKVPSKYIGHDNLVKPYYIICWTASYLHLDTVWSASVNVRDTKDWSDKRILKKLRDLMESADVIAGHNVDAYDIKRINTRLLMNGLEPVTGKRTLDTLKIARQKFAFESNRLDYISQILGFRPKDDISNDDWLKIVADADKATLDKILTYNVGDVENGKNVLRTLMKYSGKREDYGAVRLQEPFSLPVRLTQ